MKDVKSVIIGFLLATSMFLFMGQTSVIVADEKSSWNPLNFNRGHNSKMENVNFNEELNKINERCNRLDSKFKGLSKHTKNLQESTRLHYKAYDVKVDSINLTFDKLVLQIESLNEKALGMKRTNKNKFIKIEKDLNNLRKDFDALNAKWIEEFGDDE